VQTVTQQSCQWCAHKLNSGRATRRFTRRRTCPVTSSRQWIHGRDRQDRGRPVDGSGTGSPGSRRSSGRRCEWTCAARWSPRSSARSWPSRSATRSPPSLAPPRSYTRDQQHSSVVCVSVCLYTPIGANGVNWPPWKKMDEKLKNESMQKRVISNKIYETILSNSTRKLLWFEITKMPIRVFLKIVLCNLLYFSAHFRSLLAKKCRGVVNVAMNNYPYGIF